MKETNVILLLWKLIRKGPWYTTTPLVLIVSLVAGLGTGCRKDSPLDFGALEDPTARGRIDTTSITTSLVEESIQDTVTVNGRGPFLELGKFGNLSSRILMKFSTLPDTITINRATLILDTNTIFTDGRNRSIFTARIHRSLSDWEERNVTSKNFGGSVEPAVLAEARIISSAADFAAGDSLFLESVRFDFNDEGLDVVRSWQDTLRSDNFGVLIDFDPESRFIKEFFSQNGPLNQPRLELDITTPSKRDTIFRLPREDAFLVEMDEPLTEGPLFVDDLFSLQSTLKFDLSAIPRESTINRAVLFLTVKDDATAIKTSGYGIRIERLATELALPAEFRIDSTFVSITDLVTRNTSILSITVTNLIQFWVTGAFENHGLLIRTRNPGRDVSRLAFHSSQTSSSLAPRLEISFTSGPTFP